MLGFHTLPWQNRGSPFKLVFAVWFKAPKVPFKNKLLHKKLCAGLGLYHFGPLCQGLQPVKECLLFVRFVQRCPGQGFVCRCSSVKTSQGTVLPPALFWKGANHEKTMAANYAGGLGGGAFVLRALGQRVSLCEDRL